MQISIFKIVNFKIVNAILHFIQCTVGLVLEKTKEIHVSPFARLLFLHVVYTHWNKHIIENKTIDISSVSPGTDLAYFC